MIPFGDLRAQYHSIKAEIDAAIAATLESSQFILGKEVAAFEEEFAAFQSTRHCIGTNSGTSALHLALLAAGVGAGDEVITTPFTFVATAAAILYAGARPVFVDIEPETYNLDPAQIAAAITPRTKAIMPVHLFGHPADLDPIMETARRHGLVVIEDSAQAHAAEYKGRRVGSIGDIACFSFYPGKNLGAFGEAGCVVSNNPELARTVRLLRNWGEESRYHHILRGYNYRMEGLQGAILRVKLKHLEAWTEARRSRAGLYAQALKGAGIKPPRELPWARHVYHVHAIESEDRWDIQKDLAAQGIQTAIHYPEPIHMMAPYRDPAFPPGSLPQAERVASGILSLPIYPELPESSVEEIAAAVRTSLAARV
ncbi:MAG TPA: DegT/DnrJ/EryC1/StrS family aminotransferase [Bryobacteraceae bacterium]|jgi:dTDP-4-amino-4,6-dideoxygalactose transaminase